MASMSNPPSNAPLILPDGNAIAASSIISVDAVGLAVDVAHRVDDLREARVRVFPCDSLTEVAETRDAIIEAWQELTSPALRARDSDDSL